MKELSRAGKNEVIFRINFNYNNIYSRLKMLLGEDIDFFADLKITAKEVVWFTTLNLPFQSLSMANEEEKTLIYEELIPKINFFQTLLSQTEELAANTNDILNIPDENDIFFAIDENQNVKIVLAKWGCTKPFTNRSDNEIIRAIARYKDLHQLVRAKISYFDHKVAGNEKFRFEYLSLKDRLIETDENGEYKIGTLLTDKEFSLINENTGERISKVVLKEKELYEFVFSIPVSVTINVVNQYKEPIHNLPVKIEHLSLNDIYHTDEEGKIELSDLLYNDQYKSKELIVNILPTSSETYILNTDKNEFLIEYKENFFCNPIIKVIDQKGNKCGNYPLLITLGNSPEEIFETDSDGIIQLPQLGIDKEVIIRDTFDSGKKAIVTTQRDDREYVFTIEKEYVTDSFIKVINQHHIPQLDYPIRISIQGSPEVDYRTNQEGMVSLSSIKEESKLRITDKKDTENSQEYLIIDNSPLLFFIKTPEKKYVRIHLTDKEENSVRNALLKIQTGKKRIEKQTNESGYIDVDYDNFIPEKKVKIEIEIPTMKVKGCTFKFKKDCLEYFITIKDRNKWWRYLLLLLLLPFLLLINCNKTFIVQTVNEADKSVPNVPVEVTYKASYFYKNNSFFHEEYVDTIVYTNNEGEAELKSLGYSLYSFLLKMFRKIEFKANTPEETVSKKLFFHFQISPCNVLLKLEPRIVDVFFETRDGITEKTISNATLSYTISSFNKNRQGQCITDENGIASIKSLPINSEISQLSVYHTDYYEISIPLLKTKEIYHQTQIIYLDRPRPCTGMDNAASLASDGFSLVEYDMGQSKGEFIFEYETFSWEDYITIYNSPQNNISKNNIIWDTLVSTTGKKAKKIPFTSQLITVKVVSGRKGSDWNYKVNCPIMNK